MKEFRGVWSEHCVADEDLKLHGIAEAGLTVCKRVKVTMHGLIQGPVLVEKDAVLCLYGVFEGEIDDRGAGWSFGALPTAVPRRKVVRNTE